jgi:DNA polymerase III delta prime subunit
MQYDTYPIIASVKNKLDFFLHSKKIPHIIFHGPSGTGKRTIVNQFLSNIYGNDKAKMKSNIMFVNCAHGKGIKFIREELKFFAKSNIQFNCGVMFKTIILLNADFLTIDAQSALRRCIELFSFNTRFFIIVENKHKLLNPILSRFCDIYIPETIGSNGSNINLHQHTIQKKYTFEELNKTRMNILSEKMFHHLFTKDGLKEITHIDLVNLVCHLYESGYSCIDVIEWIKKECNTCDEKEKSSIILVFYKIKSEYRSEKLLMLYILDYTFLRQNKDIKNIGFM